MRGGRAMIGAFVVTALAVMGCGDDDDDGAGETEDEITTEEEPITEIEQEAVEETLPPGAGDDAAPASAAPAEEATTDQAITDDGAVGDCLPSDAAFDPAAPVLTPEQVIETIEAAIIDRRRSQVVGFELYVFDADELLEVTSGLPVEAAVREMFVTISGIDPLGPESTAAQNEAHATLVDQAWTELEGRCEQGEAFDEALEAVLLSIGEQIDETYPSAIVSVSCGQLDDRLREIGDTVGATAGPAAAQLASAEEYQAYVDELAALGFPAGSPLSAFVDELSDDIEAQLAIAGAFERFEIGLANDDQALIDAATVDFFTNAQITIDEGREAAAAAEAADLDICVEVFTRSADEGQATLDQLVAEPEG